MGRILAENHPAIDLEPMLEFVIENAVVFSAASLAEPVCDDPDDDKFPACALASGGDIIVSGDKHLLNVSGYRDIEILKPRNFVNKYLGRVHTP